MAMEVQTESLKEGVNWLGNSIYEDMEDLISGKAILKDYDDLTDEEIKEELKSLERLAI